MQMIKRTIYFGNPAYLSKKYEQLIIRKPTDKEVSGIQEDENTTHDTRSNQSSIPIEDIGILILDHPQITITQGLLESLLNNNCSIVACSSKHLPLGLFLPLESNKEQSQRFREQIEASIPLKKKLWQQTVSAKILNQAILLNKLGVNADNMKKWSRDVRSGDPDNFEGRAAAFYWKNIFPKEIEFQRDRYGSPPNNLLNYGYAILRATIARALVASGLLPTLGIHHHNKYNAYCLVDDIMEPYRPYVDDMISTFIRDGEDFTELTSSIKKQLLTIPVIDVWIEDQKRPLMIAAQRTTSSLAKCFAGEQRKLIYPVFKI